MGEGDVLAQCDQVVANAGEALGAAFTTASTLLGVAALGYRGQLVELDLTAAFPGQPAAP